MKPATFFIPALGVLLSTLFALSTPALASEQDDPEAEARYSRQELTQMLAPIALYPDALLSQILMAATYPIEVIEADRWIKKHPDIKGDELDTELLDKDWAPSVKALCHFPAILSLMSDKISQTTELGNAFLAQEEEVMDVVQELRARAYAQGNLYTSDRQKVLIDGGMIIILPLDPKVVYVPYYDPLYIYGAWWYPAYLPYYWLPPGVSVTIGISYWPAFYFGFVFEPWCTFDWHRRYIVIDVHRRPRYVRHDRWFSKPGPWRHHPRHRRGIGYRDSITTRQYRQYPQRDRAYQPDDGRYEQQERERPRSKQLRQEQRHIERQRREQTERAPNFNRQDEDRRERQYIERDWPGRHGRDEDDREKGRHRR